MIYENEKQKVLTKVKRKWKTCIPCTTNKTLQEEVCEPMSWMVLELMNDCRQLVGMWWKKLCAGILAHTAAPVKTPSKGKHIINVEWLSQT